jgi:hypothetical protein
MLKKSLIITGILLALLLAFMMVRKSMQVEWGHHFSIANELGIEIDSVKITIGKEVNWLYAGSDRQRSMEGNLSVPSKGYPHRVQILIFSKGRKHKLKAEDFNCYNCDGSHEYILRKEGAVYVFHN